MAYDLNKAQKLEHHRVFQMTPVRQTECACNRCKKMCEKTPCIGTPADILKIIEAGYADKIEVTRFAAGLIYNFPVIDILATLYDVDKKACAFLEAGKCILHDKGLKPLEGQLANCKYEMMPTPGSIQPAIAVAAQWDAETNTESIYEAFKTYLNSVPPNGKK